MPATQPGSLSIEAPIAFADGTTVYARLAKTAQRHKKGLFILAPSGVGKTHYIRHQKKNDWIDGDILWQATNAHPEGAWWLESIEAMDEIDQRSDVVTVQAKKLGFWILGASNNWLKPDAIVLPHWHKHKKYIRVREETNYDGGATSDRLSQVLGHRRWIRRWTKQGVPLFHSVDEAVRFLTKR